MNLATFVPRDTIRQRSRRLTIVIMGSNRQIFGKVTYAGQTTGHLLRHFRIVIGLGQLQVLPQYSLRRQGNVLFLFRPCPPLPWSRFLQSIPSTSKGQRGDHEGHPIREGRDPRGDSSLQPLRSERVRFEFLPSTVDTTLYYSECS